MKSWLRPLLFVLATQVTTCLTLAQSSTDWPSFRGYGGRGIADGFPLPIRWNADANKGPLEGVLWETRVPGLGHSSPTVAGNRLFLLTAVADDGNAELVIDAGGAPTAAAEDGTQSWLLLCYDKKNGNELWRKTVRQGKPRATRHAKATHANTSVVVNDEHVVVFLGSEGLHCYDLDGNLRWTRDLGVVNISKYGIGWGYASSPAVFKDRIALVCDDPSNAYLVMLSLNDGEEIWRVNRTADCERSWGTPLIHSSDGTTQVVVNGWPWIVSYDFETGDELWRLEGGGDNPVPTPFIAHDWIYITSSHGAQSPIYVVRPEARGKLSLDSSKSSDPLVWSTTRGGSYMSTPVVSGDYLYLGNSNGVVRCFHAKTGEKVYEERLGKDAGIIASLVASDGKVICASENGTVYVLPTTSEFKILASNSMGEPCFATPAISEGVLYIRTTERLVAIKNETGRL